jgi:oligopeptidase A
MPPEMKSNPLFNQGELPDFSAIRTEHIVPAVRAAIAEGDSALAAIEQLATVSWETFVLPLRQISRRLDRIWGAVTHLMGVKNSDELRAAHDLVQPEIVEFQLRLSQSRSVYDSWQKLRATGESELNSPARRRIAAAAIRDAELAGVALNGDPKKRFNDIQRDLAALGTRFSNAVLDATKEFQLLLREPGDVAGLPQSWRAMAAQAATTKGEKAANAADGPWLLTLDFPSYFPFMQHATNRALRERVYRASATRAGGLGYSEKWNNWPLIDQILQLRAEEAKILGYGSFADVSLAAKMAPDVQKIREMITELAKVAKPKALLELETLKTFATNSGIEGELALWDISYYSERQREKLYNFTDEELRPYFPLPKVLGGMFALAEKLLGVRIRESKKAVQTWHADVQFFEVFDLEGNQIAGFFLDPYARSGEKRGGAWMDVCRQREILDGALVLPVAYLVCNGSPPVTGDGARPSLMTFGEVETLFHEFGHGLQHMLTRVDEYEAAGISNVEWDAVELPSQFMENWVYERDVIDQISGHFETGELLPQPLFEKIRAAKNYMSASMMLRQLYFSLLDLELHQKYDGSVSVKEIQSRIAQDYTVMAPLEEDAFLCSFTHIFAGGYAAGYYSYKWAEVLSADAFAAFEEAGLSDPDAISSLGKKYRETVLAEGGSRHPLEVYRDFRGRDATIDALLRHSGLLGNAA